MQIYFIIEIPTVGYIKKDLFELSDDGYVTGDISEAKRYKDYIDVQYVCKDLNLIGIPVLITVMEEKE